jgi:hypothetical protein
MQQREQPAWAPESRFEQVARARALKAYIERRKQLTDRIKAERPSVSESEIEERLEQFGA